MHPDCRFVSRLAIACAAAGFFGSPAPAQDFALERLNNSPRHHEWVEVKRAVKGEAGEAERVIHCFVAYPEVEHKALAVIVIHENKGLTDWVRSVADQLAEHGYIAIAPDLLSGHGPGGGRTSDFESPDKATQAIGRLKPEQGNRFFRFSIYPRQLSNVARGVSKETTASKTEKAIALSPRPTRLHPLFGVSRIYGASTL